MGSDPARHPDVSRLVADRLRRDPEDPDALFALAAVRATEGRFQESIDVLDRLVGINPRYPGVWRLKEKVYTLSGALEQAARCRIQAAEDEG